MSAIPVDTWAGSHSIDDLANHLANLRRRKRENELEIMEVEDALIAAMGGEWQVTVDGLGVLRRHGGKRRTRWQHDDLMAECLRLGRTVRRVDSETGELESEAEAAVRHIRECSQPSYWRTTALKERGLQPDEYSEVTWGRGSVEIMQAGTS